MKDSFDAFDKISEKFFQETGYYAPGTDVPIDIWNDNYDKKRLAAWLNWVEDMPARLKDLLGE